MNPVVSIFKHPPDGGRGYHRDMRVRWALEEVGQPYTLRHLTFSEMRRPEYLEMQPFGQMPIYQEDDLILFESGAIVLHIAQRFAGLLPDEVNARSRSIMWMFAAVNTIEPCIASGSVGHLSQRLQQLGDALGGREWLEEAQFGAGDLMMVSVLRPLKHSDILLDSPGLQDYVERGEQRSAFQRALGNPPADRRTA
ncbi:glutathione S-transferase family protein [Agrobacterium leguminum]|uniref:glutathione S-transferase family protein n=1 Tax=Agrobacterium leguminum TaxID=2792015 RepID=UPI0022B84882|nr:glutathione S-transferase family protein [Agrobacterium leguminum]MCZ7932977.1 glutathione S-transferase family protein [Agrobacterium leguminum]